jgi:hypothetical protein
MRIRTINMKDIRKIYGKSITNLKELRSLKVFQFEDQFMLSDQDQHGN